MRLEYRRKLEIREIGQRRAVLKEIGSEESWDQEKSVNDD